MRITQWGEFGVLCSIFIAQSERAGTPRVNANDISTSQGIDQQYTQQILQRLRRGGIIESVRGPQGGYKLTRPAAELTLREILTAAEGDTFEIICESKPIDSERCHRDFPCNLRPIWFRLKDHINDFLSGYTLASLLDAPAQPEETTVQISRPRAALESV